MWMPIFRRFVIMCGWVELSISFFSLIFVVSRTQYKTMLWLKMIWNLIICSFYLENLEWNIFPFRNQYLRERITIYKLSSNFFFQSSLYSNNWTHLKMQNKPNILKQPCNTLSVCIKYKLPDYRTKYWSVVLKEIILQKI